VWTTVLISVWTVSSLIWRSLCLRCYSSILCYVFLNPWILDPVAVMSLPEIRSGPSDSSSGPDLSSLSPTFFNFHCCSTLCTSFYLNFIFSKFTKILCFDLITCLFIYLFIYIVTLCWHYYSILTHAYFNFRHLSHLHKNIIVHNREFM